jgi:hypothetical protein
MIHHIGQKAFCGLNVTRFDFEIRVPQSLSPCFADSRTPWGPVIPVGSRVEAYPSM